MPTSYVRPALLFLLVLAVRLPAQLPLGRPAAEGIDSVALAALDRDLASGRYGLVDGFALVRNGKLIWSSQWQRNYDSVYRALQPTDTVKHQFNYDHPDWHPWYNRTDLHTLQSVTKSVTSLLVGIAIARGEIASIDTPIVQWFDTTRIANLDDRKRRITLRHILTMSPGIEWNESLPYTDPANSAVILEASSDWVAYAINLPMSHEPGTHWAYSSGASQLMGAILAKATGRSVADFAREHLFAPLGISRFYWKQTPTGLHDTEGGLYLRTEDLAKIAWMVHQRGAWNGRQLVPASWVEQSLTATAPTAQGARFGYGFQWWLYADPTRPGKFLPSGSGYGGQFPMLFPDDSMVVVINQWNIHGPPSMGPPELARRVRGLLLRREE